MSVRVSFLGRAMAILPIERGRGALWYKHIPALSVLPGFVKYTYHFVDYIYSRYCCPLAALWNTQTEALYRSERICELYIHQLLLSVAQCLVSTFVSFSKIVFFFILV